MYKGRQGCLNSLVYIFLGQLERFLYVSINKATPLKGYFLFADAAFDCSSSDPNDCTCVTVIGPEETTVLSNTALSLQCNVSNTVGNEVQWIKGATPLGLDPTIPGK